MRTTWGIFLLLLLAVFLMACSSEPLTGSSTAQASTLTIKTESENGSIITGASIYVNGEFKGKTNTYGDEKGARLIVLEGNNNLVTVEKEDYGAAEPRVINAVSGGNQQVTFVLESRKTDLLVIVQDRYGPVSGAQVSLRKGDTFIVLGTAITDEDGVATFSQVDDGSYTLQVRKDGYIPEEVEETVDHFQNNGGLSTTILLTKIPELYVTIVDRQGQPLDDAEASLYSRQGYHSPGTSAIATAYTGSSGEVLFQNVDYDEQYVIVVRRAQYLSATHEVVLTPDTREVTVEMIWDIG
ncbi:carboxypeptidase regulatory-like domain-containing protein [Candidatus Woesearchaeota archaeon]|nr:carboxypeptidase regulatory-like domain-containing protein [Candidatus Woesearchaeota archaeon]